VEEKRRIKVRPGGWHRASGKESVLGACCEQTMKE